jgi:cytoskeletal protein CcmA (bactofilin family)
MGFKADEKRNASFKHLYNIAQTVPSLGTEGESLETGHQIYAEDLLSSADTIVYQTNPDNISFSTQSIWSGSSFSSAADVWDNGAFSQSTVPGGNVVIEKVTVPLVHIDEGWNTYAAYISSSQSNTGQEYAGTLAANNSSRLKNWINPSRFGAAYKVKVYASNTSSNYGPTAFTIPEAGNTATGKDFGGWAFDYYQGVLIFAKEDDADNDPDISGYDKPLYLEGYRYIGPTGSAGSEGGITEITATTETNLDFDPDTATITIGAQSKAIGVGSLSPYKRLYFNKDFARDNARNSSSVIINSTASADGLPYTSGSDNALLIPTIHMPFGKGYAIRFTASNTPHVTCSLADTYYSTDDFELDAYYFTHSVADNWDKMATDSPEHFTSFTYEDPAASGPFTVRVLDTLQQTADRYNQFERYRWYLGQNTSSFIFDVSGKTKQQIAEGLQTLINTNMIKYVSASVSSTESDDWELKVEQVYAGNPYESWCAKFVGSVTESADGTPILPIANNFSGSHFPKDKYGGGDYGTPTGGKPDLKTSTERCQNMYKPEGQECIAGGVYLTSELAAGTYIMSTIGFSFNADLGVNFPSPGISDGLPMSVGDNSSRLTIEISDVTGSNFPYANNITLINGETGQLNPSAKSIMSVLEKVIKEDLYRVPGVYYGNLVKLGETGYTGSAEPWDLTYSKQYMQDNNGFIDYNINLEQPFIQYANSIASNKGSNTFPLQAQDLTETITHTWATEYEPDYIDVSTLTLSNITTSLVSGSADYTSSGYANLTGLVGLDNRTTTKIRQAYASHSTHGTVSAFSSSGDTVYFEPIPSASMDATDYVVYYPSKSLAGTYARTESDKAKDLFTYQPLTYNYKDPESFLASSTVLQTLATPLKIIGDVEIIGTLSASAYEGVTGGGGTGTGFPFTGSAGISGSLSASGYISASSFIGDGSQLTGVPASDDYVVSAGTASLTSITASGDLLVTGSITASNISASGYISASTFVGSISGYATTSHTHSDYYSSSASPTFTNISASGYISASTFVGSISGYATTSHTHSDYYESGSTPIFADITASGNLLVTGSIIASGNISSSADVYARSLFANNAEIAGNTNISAGHLTVTNTISSTGITSLGDITASGNLLVTGSITASNISASGYLYATLGDAAPGSRLVAHKDGEFITTRMIQRDSETFVEDNWEISGSLYVSGSSTFMDDVSVTGDITTSGDISSSAYVYADRFYSNGQIALNNDGTSIVLGNDGTYPIRIGKLTNPISIIGNVTASGDISASGDLMFNKIDGGTF